MAALLSQARGVLARATAAAAGGTLVAAGLALAPSASAAGLTDLLTTVAPVIVGTGDLTSSGSVVCSALGAAGAQTACSTFTLGELTGLTQMDLVAQAPSGWRFDTWSGCPDPSGSTCVLDTSLLDPSQLGTTIAPVATFLPISSTPGAAPDTKITGKPAVDGSGSSDQTDATFTYQAVGGLPGTSFECSLTTGQAAPQFAPCGSGSSASKTYTGLQPGGHTFEVRAVAAGIADPTPSTFTWSIGSGSPSTRLVGGPRQGGWLHSARAVFGLRSDRSAASYRCTVDGRQHRCGSRLVLRHVAAGTHTVTAAAVVGSQADDTPARRTFTRPLNDRALGHAKAWGEHTGARGYFMRSFAETRRHGATLRHRAHHIKKIVLVATRGRHFGTVKVFLGKHLLKKVPLRARALRKQRFIPVVRFRRPQRGLVRVVVVSRGKAVRVEGLGIAHR